MKHHTPSVPVDSTNKVTRAGTQGPVYAWRGKNFYPAAKPDLLIQEFPPNGSDNGKKRARPKDPGALRNQISSYLFEYLNGFHIPTHFVDRLSDSEMTVKRIEFMPIGLKIYNIPDEELRMRLGLGLDVSLEFPIFEHFFTDANGRQAWINEYHIYALNLATPEEFKQLNRLASKVNAVLRGLCERRQLLLADITLSFGRLNKQIVLADELSHRTCRFLDSTATEKSRRDRFLPGEGTSDDAILELCDRLTLKV